MKNPKSAAGGRGSSHKTFAANAVGGADGRKSHWDSSKKLPSDRNAPSDSTPFKEDIPGPSSGPMKPTAGATLPAATLPPTFHHHTSASSPPPSPYGFHNLDRQIIVLADGTVPSYFALPPDYQMDPSGDKFFHPGNPQGFDPHIPALYGPEGFREPPPPFPMAALTTGLPLDLRDPRGRHR